MRKVFLASASFKVGMLIVKRDSNQAEDKPIPMADNDYLRVQRKAKNIASQRLLMEICNEDADPGRYQFYARQAHPVVSAFDALREAVQGLSDE